jgi:dTDP-4-amino-4,6-dideoxygalactose transaminase
VQIESRPIYVTQPSLAPLAEFNEYLGKIWSTGVMTHNGPFLLQLEKDISAYLNIHDAVCLSNGTSALQLAIRAMDLHGEIITTPFTFIATANIIAWERCTPVFVDIDPGTWNIDADKIEAAITDKTCAILPVHVFSAPCDVEKIEKIAEQYDLKVIYDAAHAMCVKTDGKSIMNYGDISCTSFHATKLFNTCEGGACFSRYKDLLERIRRMRFFGFDVDKNITDGGMNAKMTEISAVLGLANLQHLPEVEMIRRSKYELYMELLADCKYVSFQQFNPEAYNYSYMPILLDTEERLFKVLKVLNDKKIYPRRYFYPSLHTLDIFKHQSLPIAEDIASRILCLPLYTELKNEDIEQIGGIITNES